VTFGRSFDIWDGLTSSKSNDFTDQIVKLCVDALKAIIDSFGLLSLGL